MEATMNLDAFAAHLVDNERSALTVKSYVAELARFAAWYHATNGRELVPAELTRPDVRDYRAHLQTVVKAKPATINKRLSAIRAWCAWLLDTEQITNDPSAGVKLVQEQRPGAKWLDRRELGKLEREAERALNAARTPWAKLQATRNRAILMLLAHSGLRVAELTALEWGDLQIGERSGHVRVRAGKGDKERRVPLNAEARRPLVEWRDVRPPSPGACVFVDGQGVPLMQRAVQLALGELARRAGVEATPHTLRHTFAKNLVDTGVPLDHVADLLGHSTLETTRIYTRASERDLERDVERLEG